MTAIGGRLLIDLKRLNFGWMLRSLVMTVALATACSSSESKPSPQSETPGPEAPTEPDESRHDNQAPQKPTSFTHRVLLSKEITIPELRRRIAAAADGVRLSHEPGDPKSKCRRVYFLDAEAGDRRVLREAGMSLRVRRKLDRTCNLETNRLAMSFNLRSGDLSRAAAARDELTPFDDLADRRTRLRYRLDTSVGPKVYTPRYVAGGTVRGLREEPATLADLRRMFPKLKIDGDGELSRMITVTERAYDLGTVSNGSVTMPVEVSAWTRDDAHVVTEISYEYEDAEGAGSMATNFANALKAQLDGAIHSDAVWREDVVYGGSVPDGD